MVLLTGHGTIDLAVKAIKEGAEQFFTKPVELPALLVVLERALENRRMRQVSLAGKSSQARQARGSLLRREPGHPQAGRARRRAWSPSAVPVLIQGETGTGKGVLARWLHQNGPRADEPFVDLNCAGLSRELLESELFGHEKGAFTGAVAAKPGLLEIAHRGTLFLDEIGDVDLQVQAKLLKVVEDLRFRRLGDVRDRQVDVRLVAATHRDLGRLVQEQKFREDLYYRISAHTARGAAAARARRATSSCSRAAWWSASPPSWAGPDVRLSGGGGAGARCRAPGRATSASCATCWSARSCSSDQHDPGARGPGRGDAPRRRRPRPADGADRPWRRRSAATSKPCCARSGAPCRAAAEVLGLSRSALYERIKKHGIAVRKPTEP